ncbi:MAG: hypothetical protein WC821_01855 [archaeon]|jgi:hypothetical protein
MDKQTIVKYLGILVLVVMAFSMLAAGMLSANRSASDTSTDPLPQAKDNPFDYTLTFDANAIKELSSARFGGLTTETDKSLIDSAVLKVEGVSKVTSKFSKTSLDANNWVYLAELTVKKGFDVVSVTQKISDLNFFEKENFQAMKYMTISVPSYIMLHNIDLNIDRNFSFPTATSYSLVGTSTASGDEIVVNGQITVQGSAVLALELIESTNKTQERAMQEYLNQLQLDQNITVDTNAAVDTNLS